MNSTRPDLERTDRNRTDLICIDRAAQSDLMFWNLLGNALLGQAHRPPIILLVEPGVADVFGSGGGVMGLEERMRGERVQEERVREEVKEAVFRLTDLGLATVGFTGCDRKFIQIDEQGIRLGDWSILMDSAGRNVVVLVASVARHPEREWVSLPPVQVALKAQESHGNHVRVVHMTQRLTSEIQAAGESGQGVPSKAVERVDGLPSDWTPGTPPRTLCASRIEVGSLPTRAGIGPWRKSK